MTFGINVKSGARTTNVAKLLSFGLWLVAAALWIARAEGEERELLNSERIEAKFGSYGVDVLKMDGAYRVSSLYSVDGGTKTCRTFAVVRYPTAVDSAIAAEHAEIVAGGSIGAVFAAHGWQVRKSHLYFGELAATPRLAKLMHIEAGTRLAQHAYVLDVVKDGKAIEYAALVETHHPAYLRRAELPAIYGPAASGTRNELLSTLLAGAAHEARD